jgi:hypothetical protein
MPSTMPSKFSTIELAQKCGMTKTSQSVIQPLWLASDLQLQTFAHTIIYQVKQNASVMMVEAIKKAVEYEREQCSRIASAYPEIAQAIKERGDD